MIQEYTDWRDYQLQVAAFFRKCGCEAEVEVTVEGARGTHDVDVLVTFHRHGLLCKWVIECKLWKTRVPKEKVMALKAIVEDIGADKGIIFSESGFQKGALIAARTSNITLQTNLGDFEKTANVVRSEVALLEQADDRGDGPSILAFPTPAQPHTLALYDGRLYVGDWGGGRIAVVNPDDRVIEAEIELDRYETQPSGGDKKAIARYQPGAMTLADGKLFVGQVFSEFILAIDTDTHSIIKRIAVPGGGEGAICSSADGKYVYFASNRERCFFAIDSATYSVSVFDYPEGGRGSQCILAHPTKPLVYVGIQRGGRRNGRPYPYANSFLATFDLERRIYCGYLNLDQIINGRTDDAIPISLVFDEEECVLYVGMFQSRMGICVVNEDGTELDSTISFPPNERNAHFPWADPLAQALYRDRLLSVNRNNQELAIIDKGTLAVEQEIYLGDAPNGPRDIVVRNDLAIVSYPERGGLVFLELDNI